MDVCKFQLKNIYNTINFLTTVGLWVFLDLEWERKSNCQWKFVWSRKHTEYGKRGNQRHAKSCMKNHILLFQNQHRAVGTNHKIASINSLVPEALWWLNDNNNKAEIILTKSQAEAWLNLNLLLVFVFRDERVHYEIILNILYIHTIPTCWESERSFYSSYITIGYPFVLK